MKIYFLWIGILLLWVALSGMETVVDLPIIIRPALKHPLSPCRGKSISWAESNDFREYEIDPVERNDKREAYRFIQQERARELGATSRYACDGQGSDDEDDGDLERQEKQCRAELEQLLSDFDEFIAKEASFDEDGD